MLLRSWWKNVFIRIPSWIYESWFFFQTKFWINVPQSTSNIIANNFKWGIFCHDIISIFLNCNSIGVKTECYKEDSNTSRWNWFRQLAKQRIMWQLRREEMQPDISTCLYFRWKETFCKQMSCKLCRSWVQRLSRIEHGYSRKNTSTAK